MSDTNTNAGANETTPGRKRRWIIAAIVAVALIVAAIAIVRGRRGDAKPADAEAAEEHHDEGGGNAVELGPEAAAAADIQLVAVTQRSAVVPLRTTGTIEANEQRMQQVSPLVNGRVDRVYAAPGDRVRAGAVLAELSSPEVAELKGKLLEAHSRQNLADANLRRLRKLSDLGAAAGKDLAAAESEAQTAQAEVAHIRGSLSALGADASGGRSIGTLALRAPIGGTITQRFVNPGAGVQAGSPVFAIADLSSVWVIANVPEAQVQLLTIGSEARVHSAALGQQVAAGRVSYIDPILNEETRTARVRIESANPDQRLKIGTFV
ncbi:MAG TPA: efflux RND transporter periplasmic adaptor subunit, partial [Thermoanaerobaculia bacterium]|nr:efflux RND transporter periplasmic adaptor subunit [Thermoanaerobaculia bacterium]